jgi:hypothetical protein
MTTSDQQVRIIMKELSKHGNQGRAAVKAGVCRQTAARYIEVGKLSSEIMMAGPTVRLLKPQPVG